MSMHSLEGYLEIATAAKCYGQFANGGYGGGGVKRHPNCRNFIDYHSFSDPVQGDSVLLTSDSL